MNHFPNSNLAITASFDGHLCARLTQNKSEFMESLPDSISDEELLVINQSFDRAVSDAKFLHLRISPTDVMANDPRADLLESSGRPASLSLVTNDAQYIASAAVQETRADELSELIGVYNSVKTPRFRQAVLAFARIMAQGKAPFRDSLG